MHFSQRFRERSLPSLIKRHSSRPFQQLRLPPSSSLKKFSPPLRSSHLLVSPASQCFSFSEVKNTYRLFKRYSSSQAKDATEKAEEAVKDDTSVFQNLLLCGLAAAFVYGAFFWKKQEPKLLGEHESHAKYSADSLNGEIDNDGKIRRVKQKKRLHFSTLDDNGIKHGQLDGTKWMEPNGDYYVQTYWNDEAAYEFSLEAATTLRDASWELHHMCLEAVDLVVNSDELMDIFEIPMNLRPSIRESWRAHEPDLIGRFDFIWDGSGDPKLLEYNADTPTVLVESAIGQKLWFEYAMSSNDNVSCFNDLHQNLIHAWKHHIPTPKVDSVELIFIERNRYETTTEDVEHQSYVKDAAILAGIEPKSMSVGDVMLELVKEKGEEDSGAPSVFSPLSSLEMQNDPQTEANEQQQKRRKTIRYIWKGFPYEYLAGEPLGKLLFGSTESSDFSFTSLPSTTNAPSPSHVHLIEPSWKIILGNKAILALLWEMFPNHPNLLYSTYDRQEAIHDSVQRKISMVSKPKYGREGNGIHVHQYDSSRTQEDITRSWDEIERKVTSGDDYYGELVFQEFRDIQRFHGRKIVIGSWIIRGKPSGLCVREDVSSITNDNSSIVPHYVAASKRRGMHSPNFSKNLPTLSAEQIALRRKLYPETNSAQTDPVRGGRGSSGGGGGWWWFRDNNQRTSSGGSSSGSSTDSGTGTASGSSNASKEDRARSKAKAYHEKRWGNAPNRRASTGGRRFGNGIGKGSS
jgi:glutathionylspermidine synthase